ncbi:unnamed protein product [Vitrella brassicaformis CCMP3155]|uniref:Protein NO VEIN C-terminal domain-containing protein n=1 Tax=Vitrella brassicaformis (strain CCMP3155) TaxID=1169540 RepID=A0A0G4GBP2_VITBC|nr:unnamed protein product [Vitrella brassicaformis CCMP3155]|eukprot:CEM26440.1 unnamed protein product [Vitrella brassicaformis CCMP3155]
MLLSLMPCATSRCLSEVEVTDLIASKRVPELDSIGSALLWSLCHQPTHGPLENFILKHRSALVERRVSVLHCVDPLTGSRQFVKVTIRDKGDIYRALEAPKAVHKPKWLACQLTSFLCASGGVRNLTSSALLVNSFRTFWANLKAASQQQQDGTALMPDWEKQSAPFLRRLPHAAHHRLFALSWALDLPMWIEAFREVAEVSCSNEALTELADSKTPAGNVRKEDAGGVRAVIESIQSNLDLESQLRAVQMSPELRTHLEHSIDEAQKRQGRMLQKISTDLYEKAFHFIFENADDNHYDDGVTPSLQLTLSLDRIRLFNNEKGFNEKNIRAICDVGSSTKSRKRGESGLIGRKGIGFKSVFSQDPVVEPSDGELLFDISVESDKRLKASANSWTTLIDLPFKEHTRYQQSFLEKCTKELGNIHPPLLLFLNRLQRLSIVNRVTAESRRLVRQDHAQLLTSSLCLSVETDAEIIRLVEDDENQCWLVVRHQDWLAVRQQRLPTLTAWRLKGGERLKSEDQNDSDDGVEPTVIPVAVPLKADGEMDHQPVCAYLPLTARPMKMTLQADWTVTSSRETVKEDNVWNLWLRDEFASLLVDTVVVLKSIMTSDSPDIHLPPDFLFRLLALFPDLSVDRSSWYHPVVEGFQSRLKKGIAWVLTADGEWHEPSSCLLVPSGSLDDLMSIIPPADLYESMQLKYVHRAIAQLLERQGNIDTRGRQLGMAVGSASFFFNYLVRLHEAGKLVEKPIDWLGKVFLVLHTATTGTRHNTKEKAKHMEQMKALPLVPIRGGEGMAANECQLFLPRWEGEFDVERFSLWHNCGVHWCAESHQSQYAFELQMPTVDPALWVGRDDDEKTRIVEVLGRFGVKHATDELLIAFLAQHLNDETDAQVWASVSCYLLNLGGHKFLASLPNREAVESFSCPFGSSAPTALSTHMMTCPPE